jgi:formylglycine-generating enzyme required for sulfatase activity
MTSAVGGGRYHGAVGYDYYISKYEITQGEWTAFLNAVATDKSASTGIRLLYNGSMNTTGYSGISRGDSGSSYSYSVSDNYKDRPVVFVSVQDVKRFCNWLTNQKLYGTSGTETGIYDMSAGANAVRDDVVWQLGGIALPDENEWYKAAYYDPFKIGEAGYYTYSFGHANGDQPSTDFANYYNGSFFYHDVNSPDWGNGVFYLSEVGFYENYSSSLSAYGVADMTGNVWEWTDSQYNGTYRIARGAAFNNVSNPFISADSSRTIFLPSREDCDIGFRVASLAPIPEPSTYGVIGGALVGLLCLVRRKRRAVAP